MNRKAIRWLVMSSIGLVAVSLLVYPRLKIYKDSQKHLMWNKWWQRKVNHYVSTEQNPLTFELLGYIFEKTPDQTINVVDLGCAHGEHLKMVKAAMPNSKDLYSVGVDPVNYPKPLPYTHYVQKAVTNGPEGIREFYLYGTSKDFYSAASLRKIAKPNITHDPNNRKEKFYHPNPAFRLHGTQKVEVVKLSTIIKEYKLEGQLLHFLKIDIQGEDFPVFLSLGEERMANVLFVQLESIYSPVTLYDGQSTFIQEKAEMGKLGFRILNIGWLKTWDNGQLSKNEADVIWVNTALFDRVVGHLFN